MSDRKHADIHVGVGPHDDQKSFEEERAVAKARYADPMGRLAELAPERVRNGRLQITAAEERELDKLVELTRIRRYDPEIRRELEAQWNERYGKRDALDPRRGTWWQRLRAWARKRLRLRGWQP